MFAIVGMLWAPVWWLWAYERPEDCPTISREELDALSAPEAVKTNEVVECVSSPLCCDELHSTAVDVEMVQLNKKLDNVTSPPPMQSRLCVKSDRRIVSLQTMQLFFSHPVTLTLFMQGWSTVRQN